MRWALQCQIQHQSEACGKNWWIYMPQMVMIHWNVTTVSHRRIGARFCPRKPRYSSSNLSNVILQGINFIKFWWARIWTIIIPLRMKSNTKVKLVARTGEFICPRWSWFTGVWPWIHFGESEKDFVLVNPDIRHLIWAIDPSHTENLSYPILPPVSCNCNIIIRYLASYQ